MPLSFGASRRTVSVAGERATHVQTPHGWEDRIATLVITFSMDGQLVLPVVLIFKGTGKRVNPEEEAVYNSLPGIVVLWQKKAWIDRYMEKKVFSPLRLSPSQPLFRCSKRLLSLGQGIVSTRTRVGECPSLAFCYSRIAVLATMMCMSRPPLSITQ